MISETASVGIHLTSTDPSSGKVKHFTCLDQYLCMAFAQACANLLAPLLLLALAGWQRGIRIAHQIAGYGADVVSQATSSEMRRMTP